jgi:hypothetical protein
MIRAEPWPLGNSDSVSEEKSKPQRAQGSAEHLTQSEVEKPKDGKFLPSFAVCALALYLLLLVRLLRQPGANRFGLGVEVEHIVAHFAAPSGLLVAAEG